MVLAAGFASADVSFSGTAGVALIDDNGASLSTRADMFAESYYDLDIAATAETDNGISVKLGLDLGSGGKIDYDDDDKLEVQSASIGDADVAVSYNGWTLAVDQAGIDNLFDDTDGSQDMSLSGAVMGWTVALTTDQEGSTSSYKVGGTVGGAALTFTCTDVVAAGGDATGISASYSMATLTLSASMENGASDAEDETAIGITYVINDALTFSYKSIKPGSRASDDFGDEWDAKVAYSAGCVSASFATDETDSTTVIAEYTLGGGTAFSAMHDKAGTAKDLTALGLTFAF